MSLGALQQRSDSSAIMPSVKSLYVAWRSTNPSQGWRPVGRLEFSDGVYRFRYTKGSEKPGFTPFVGMAD
jgi:hypothetical protein